ncbi:MAG: DUF5110 domain-containing protein [Anaerolineae bacterium]|nr:DUF5110 domain-containing protein [Anaerolineae bacterium]
MPSNLSLLINGIKTIGLGPALQGVAHALRTRWTEIKFTDYVPLLPAAPPHIVTAPGRFRDNTRHAHGVTLSFARAQIDVTVFAADVIRVRLYRSTDAPPTFPYTLEPGAAPPFDVVHTDDAVELHTERLICTVSKTDGRVAFLAPDRAPIASDTEPAGWTADGHAACRWQLQPDAHVYGLGERTTAMDRRGAAFTNWNTDPRTYDTGDDPINLCIPFWLTLHSGGAQGYAILLENTARSQVDVGQTDPHALAAAVDEQALGYLFFYGPALSHVLTRFTELTGRHALYPRWTLGYQQCRWSYYPEARVRQLARDFRETHHVPCDAIHLDIHYMDGYRCFTWDRERFPDPTRMLADLHAQGFKLVTIIDPGIKVDKRYWAFRDGMEKDVFCRYPDGQLCTGPVWPGDCAFPDVTAPHARTWWGDLYRGLLEDGVDGFWNDMNEPALFGADDATIPLSVRHNLEGQGSDHRRAHNVYGLQMVRATAEGLARLAPERRHFVFTRSGWTGVQRYAAHWTADNLSTWESFRLTIPMVMGLGVSGIAFTGADVGGFAGTPTAELFTRWLQLGAFLPLFRAHTILDSPDQEPWTWGEPYLSINRETIHLRYRLLPYLYTTFWQSTQTGLPVARPLFLAFQDDPATHALQDQFLCGDALLVAPVLEEGATQRSVYLPTGTWYDFWTDARHEGPARIQVEAPLERVPLFVRAGTVLPLGPVVEYVGQASDEPLTLHVYPGNGESCLYEDDGETLAYQHGEYRLTHFTLTTTPTGIVLARRTEGQPEPDVERFRFVVHGASAPPLTLA